MNHQQFPVSAVIPIYNCRERLQRHLRSVVTWASQVREIIVVDSGSTDGTLELVTEVLSPFGARILHNPPGLYQSWNAGIAIAKEPWCYISTVEDPINPEGLTHLLDVAQRHNPDVVISPPEMMNEDGSGPSDRLMPGTTLQKAFTSAGIDERVLTRTETVMMLCGFIPSGLLGSSASNLYRTLFLQQHPFPTDYGHCGDTAWGISASPILNIAFTNKICARFYCQGNWPLKTPEEHLSLHEKMADLCADSLAEFSNIDPCISTLQGWFAFHRKCTWDYWNWIRSEKNRKDHLEKKYEGGIMGYVPRFLNDEIRKILEKKKD